jgi:YidC/Oxa1 family membrane protein insertase
MEKRVILTIVICMGLLLVWQQLFPPPKTPPKRADGGVAASRADGGAAGTAASAGPGDKKAGEPGKPKAEVGTTAGGGTEPKKDGPRPPEEKTTVSTDLVDATFSSYGATLRGWSFKDKKFQREVNGKTVPIDLVTTHKENELPLGLDYAKSGFNVPLDAVWTLDKKEERADEKQLTYRYENDQVRVRKLFTIHTAKEKAYRLNLTVELTNKGQKDVGEQMGVRYTGYQDPNQQGGGMFSPQVQPRTAVCLVNDKFQSEDVKKALKGVSFDGDVKWTGINEHYFLSVMIPQGKEPSTGRRCAISGIEPGTMIAQLNFPERMVAPGKTISRDFMVYLGPKVIKQLKAVDSRLEAAVDYGILGRVTEWLCLPMLFLLQLFFGWTGNWGIAIILLTITVKLATLYWTQKSMMSMKAMSKLAPKVNELKEKYKDDRNRMNLEVMNLYKQYKVNPLGGCLPMFLQMPIYIALYTTLQNAVELYRTPFFGWLHDLSARDPYYILPIVLGGTMFIQQKLSPTTMDNAQARMMMYFMPAMFTFFMLFLPAGLTLYILVNTLLGIAHQYYMNSLDPDKPDPAKKGAPKPARA